MSMNTCEKCKQNFLVDRNSRNRKFCLYCRPYNLPYGSMKMCRGKCGLYLENNISNFNQSKGKYLSATCKICSKEGTNRKQVRVNHKKKMKAIEIYGQYKCKICGYKKCTTSLSFHHLDPNEKDGRIMQMSLDNIMSEIKKCILVCGNCHREIHAGLHPDILKVVPSNKYESIRKRERSIRYKVEKVNYLGGKCISCNYNKHISGLDFHHKDPSSKLFGISEGLHTFHSLTSDIDEVNKCVLLCSNCHNELHSSKSMDNL